MTFSWLSIISIFACTLLIVGYVSRRHRKIHIPLMVSAFTIDMGLLLYIELTRHAIEQAVESPGGLLIFHIIISVGVVVLYIGQVVSGMKKRKGQPSPWHGKAGLPLVILRVGNLITSFLVTAGSTTSSLS